MVSGIDFSESPELMVLLTFAFELLLAKAILINVVIVNISINNNEIMLFLLIKYVPFINVVSLFDFDIVLDDAHPAVTLFGAAGTVQGKQIHVTSSVAPYGSFMVTYRKDNQS